MMEDMVNLENITALMDHTLMSFDTRKPSSAFLNNKFTASCKK